MPKRKLNINCIGPFHVGIRTINRDWFNIPMDQVWRIATDQLYFCKFAFNLDIHAFVLMSNHYHLIVSTPDCNLSQAMAYFNREFSRDLNRAGNRINRTFAGRYFATHLTKYHYFMNTYKYVYQNPVRAGICKKVEDYPYSTFAGLIGGRKAAVPLVHDTLLFESDIPSHMAWLNTLPKPEDIEAMRLGLRRGEFKLPLNENTNTHHRLESELF